MGRIAALPPLPLERFQYEQPAHYTIRDAFIDYGRERVIAKGKNPLPVWQGFNNFFHVAPPEQDVTKLKTGQVEDYIDMRMTQVGSILTPKRELVFVKAAFNYALRRNRIEVSPYIELPDGDGNFRRPLTEEEFRLVIRQPMSGRLRRFYWLAYFTGHRARAIEELTWSRVDFEKGLINFNVPGRAITSKRRCADFPIPDDFLPRLRQWKETAKSEYVIGLSLEGTTTTTYNEAQYVVRELAGLKDPSLVPRHCMRKMFATELIGRMIDTKGQADMETVGWLVADKPETIRKHYLLHKPATLRAAVNLRAKSERD